MVLFGKAFVSFRGKVVISFFELYFFLWEQHFTKIPNSYLAGMIVWVNRFLLRKKFLGIALWPFIIIRKKELLNDAEFLNHEKIHLRQQAEMLVVFFYVWYVLEFLVRWLQYKNRYEAYKNISFEREAYTHEKDLNYLKKRSFFGFTNFL